MWHLSLCEEGLHCQRSGLRITGTSEGPCWVRSGAVGGGFGEHPVKSSLSVGGAQGELMPLSCLPYSSCPPPLLLPLQAATQPVQQGYLRWAPARGGDGELAMGETCTCCKFSITASQPASPGGTNDAPRWVEQGERSGGGSLTGMRRGYRFVHKMAPPPPFSLMRNAAAPLSRPCIQWSSRCSWEAIEIGVEEGTKPPHCIPSIWSLEVCCLSLWRLYS